MHTEEVIAKLRQKQKAAKCFFWMQAWFVFVGLVALILGMPVAVERLREAVLHREHTRGEPAAGAEAAREPARTEGPEQTRPLPPRAALLTRRARSQVLRRLLPDDLDVPSSFEQVGHGAHSCSSVN